MASCITAQFASGSPQCQLTVNLKSETNTTATLAWSISYVAHGYAAYTNGYGRPYSVTIDGTTVKTGSYNINGIAYTVQIASGTTTVNKTSAGRNVSFSCAFDFQVTWSGIYGGNKTASGSIWIGAATSSGGGTTTPDPSAKKYTITYNANGGYGAPSSQTKTEGVSIFLSSTKPYRSGYEFLGWSTTRTGNVVYQPGQNYTNDASITLYAVWSNNTYSVFYNANGGTGAPASQIKNYGTSLTLSNTVPTRSGYEFKGWGTSQYSTTVSYEPGDLYTTNASITLYAIWTSLESILSITNLSVDRCDSSGGLSDIGTYARVAFNWTARNGGDRVTVYYDNTSRVSSLSGTSGVYYDILGNGTFNEETDYVFNIEIRDDTGRTTTYTQTLNAMYYVIDFKNAGTGVAIGKAATEDGFQVAMDSVFDGSLHTSGEFVAESGMVVQGDSAEIKSTYLGIPNDVRFNDTTTSFLSNQGTDSTSKTRPLITNHTALDNGIYLQAKNSNGSYTNLLRMLGTQVELYWTTDGLGGDYRSTIWSGSCAIGANITVSNSKKYSLFIVTVRSVGGSSDNNTKVLAIREHADNYIGRIAGVGGASSSNGDGQYTVSVYFNQTSETRWNLVHASNIGHLETANDVFTGHSGYSECYVTKIEGLI